MLEMSKWWWSVWGSMSSGCTGGVKRLRRELIDSPFDGTEVDVTLLKRFVSRCICKIMSWFGDKGCGGFSFTPSIILCSWGRQWRMSISDVGQ